MKHLYNLCFVFFLLAFASCSPEVDDIFDESAATRIQRVIKEDLAVLQGAPNGWLLEYYPSATKMYGGYTILLSFGTDGHVNAACDLFPSNKAVESLYAVKQSTGPVLTVDSYNEIFHLFSEPSNIYSIGESGKGMEGDYEFLILECTPEKVVLKGKKTGTKMLMTPLPEGKTWKQYLDEVKKVTQGAYMGMYDVQVNGEKKYTVTQEYHRFILTHDNGVEENLPFMYTPEGIKFYEPVELGSAQMQSLTWNNSKQVYENGDIEVKGVLPANYKRIEEFVGTYIFYYYDQQRVTLEPAEIENPLMPYLVMKGFEDYRFMVTYDRVYGRIGLVTQTISVDPPLALLPWALPEEGGSGPIYTGTGVGLVGINGKNNVIRFEDNGVSGGNDVTSMIVFNLETKEAPLQIPYIDRMVKQ